MKHNFNLTKFLLACGVLAGPVYITVGIFQILTRAGFDMTRHPLSMMSLGDLGWIQIANFFVTGSLVVLGSLGLRRAVRNNKRWQRGALCVTLFGLGVITGGLFSVDPSLGFPPGTPDVAPTTMSWHAMLHLMLGQLGFLALIVSSFIFARYFKAENQRSWAMYSAFTGAFFLAAIITIGAAQGAAWASVMLYAAIAFAFVWLSTLMAYYLRQK